MTKKWKSRKVLHTVVLYVCDNLHFLGSANGPAYEALITRPKIMSFAVKDQGKKTRLMLLSNLVANYKDICEWMDASISSNFMSTALRPALEIVPYALHGTYSDQLISLCKMSLTKFLVLLLVW